ncbi:hypothetical protein FC80_GL001605 [Liquorilactobacillus cacaonum DSM 21116]|uniref:Integral membrane protein n=2 Tax=Liquorilactobacillus cacaonum TaxID=483012 RepID=A0A0R2CX73_9LACO|nr:hypothetical protein FC80_GL001605 [Liquorilactobacillus cacaonum DSM 21116]
MATMVFLMSNYNMLWRFGFAKYTFKKEIMIYPLAFCIVYLVKRFISGPVVAHLHSKSLWLGAQKKSISFPMLTILCNVTIVIAIMTLLTKNYLPHHIVRSYFFNWLHTIIVAIPVFFFIVRPLVIKVIKWLRDRYVAPI